MTGRPTGPGGCLRPWWRTMVRHCRMNHHKAPALTISNAKSVGDMLKSCESVATCFLSKKKGNGRVYILASHSANLKFTGINCRRKIVYNFHSFYCRRKTIQEELQ